MKRLNRFVLLTLGYLIAIAKVAGRVIARSFGRALRKSKLGPKKTAVFGAMVAMLAIVVSLAVATPARAFSEGTRSLTTVSLGGTASGSTLRLTRTFTMQPSWLWSATRLLRT